MVRTWKHYVVSLTGIALMAGVIGCGKKADENKPIEDVRSEAKSMDNDDLRESALSYKKAIAAKKDDLSGISQKIKEIPVTEALGKESKALQDELAQVTKSVSALSERFKIYYDELKTKNGDTAGLDIK